MRRPRGGIRLRAPGAHGLGRAHRSHACKLRAGPSGPRCPGHSCPAPTTSGGAAAARHPGWADRNGSHLRALEEGGPRLPCLRAPWEQGATPGPCGLAHVAPPRAPQNSELMLGADLPLGRGGVCGP